MTRFISLVILVAVAFVAYRIYVFWEETKSGVPVPGQTTAAEPISPQSLPGLPPQLEASLQAAQQQGTAALGRWLAAYGNQVQDPRLAWIQLDYCSALVVDSPNEAKRIFESVRARTPANSPVYGRVKELERGFGP